VETNSEVGGRDRSRIRLFALSTCIWCRKTKALLQEMDVGYECVEIDMLDGADRAAAIEELKRFNPQCSFPSLVLDGNACIVGFKEAEIREALKT
jgi:glutaredoxin-like protein NrdH